MLKYQLVEENNLDAIFDASSGGEFMTGGHLVVECLKTHGVKVIFGMPGGHTTGIYDALYDEKGIRHILVRNEQAGAFMADGYARATGDIGVCLTTAGPGVTNAATGIAASYADSIPTLLISGEIRSGDMGRQRGYYHEMNQLDFFKPITKWNACAKSASDIPKIFDKAFEMLRDGRARPVYVEVPIDVIAAEVDENDVVELKNTSENRDIIPQKADGDLIGKAAEILAEANLPLIIAGGGVISADASKELIELAELLGAQVIMTPMGKGAIPADHPSCSGLTWHRITSDLSNMSDMLSPLPAIADVVLAIGCRFTQLATGNWTLRLPENLIQIDIDETEIGKNYPVKLGITADAKIALKQLIAACPTVADLPAGSPSERSPSTRQASARRGELSNFQLTTGKQARMKPDDIRLTASPTLRNNWESIITSRLPKRERWIMPGWDIVPALREVLNRNAIMAADITRIGYMMLANFDSYLPRTFLHSTAFIAMGHGFPAALGAKVAYPNRQVVSVSGDGGFMMTGQELATAVQHNINVVAIVINDNSLNAIKAIQDRNYGGRHIAVNLHNPDFVKFADSFGAIGLRVEEPEQFRNTLVKALEADAPVLIEIAVT